MITVILRLPQVAGDGNAPGHAGHAGHAALSRPVTATRKPRAANASAVAAPIPLDPPVISTRPSR
jgi:hypothetical protein